VLLIIDNKILPLIRNLTRDLPRLRSCIKV
jgi:hypothetical protein